jgi:hypothetical protein
MIGSMGITLDLASYPTFAEASLMTVANKGDVSPNCKRLGQRPAITRRILPEFPVQHAATPESKQSAA